MSVDDREFDELARLWKARPEPSTWSAEQALMEIKKKARKFDRSILWRDVREAAAGLLALGAMGTASVLAPGWLPKLGLAVLAVCIGAVLTRLWRTRRAHGPLADDLPTVERLRGEIRKVEAQARLLRTVRSWYVMPIAVGGTAWMATLTPAIGLQGGALLAGMLFAVAASAAIFGAVGWFVVWLNRRAVRLELEPYRTELVETLARVDAG